MDGYFLAEESDYLLNIPGHTSLEKNEAADEEEHGHPELDQILMDWRRIAEDVPAEWCDMLQYNQYHGETSHGIDVLDATTCTEFYVAVFGYWLVHLEWYNMLILIKLL